MEKNQARLLFEAGKCLIEIRNYLRPQGFSQQSLIDRPYELKSALTNYPKEKIQGYLNILEKYDLREETKTLAKDYAGLEKLSRNYTKDEAQPIEISGRLKK